MNCKQFCSRVLTGSLSPAWGGPGSFLARHEAFGERLGCVLERPGSVLGRVGAVFVAFKVVLDVKMRRLGASWSVLGGSWDVLGPSWWPFQGRLGRHDEL